VTIQAAGVPARVQNPEDWPGIVSAIERHTGHPPNTDLDTVVQFLSDCVQLLFEADTTHDAQILRGTFAEPVIGQLIGLSGLLDGFTALAADLLLIGAPQVLDNAFVRIRARVMAADVRGQQSVHQQFWDIALGDLTATIGPSECANCGAPLPPGALVCAYCHTDSRGTVHVPLQVIRLQRIS
jgi:hypothetical protein